jgi:hypothetical protein
MGVLDEYLAAGGMHGMAAQSLCELLSTVSDGHPLANVAALMRATAPPSLETWAQALEVAGEMFSIAHNPEPLASEALERLQQHPPHLLSLALILLADFEGRIDPPLPDILRGSLRVHLNALRCVQLVEQVISGNDSEVEELDRHVSRYIYMMAERRLMKSDAAKQPRPRNRPKKTLKYDPKLRAAFIEAMTRARREGRTLSEFIDSVRARSVDDLELQDGPEGSGRYLLEADASAGNREKLQVVAIQTLRDWWKAAGRGELAS